MIAILSVIVFLVLVGIVGGAIKVSAMEKREKEIKTKITSLQDMDAKLHFIGVDQKTALAIDLATKKICLAKVSNSGTVITKVISYRDLLSAEIIQDGVSTTQTARQSVVGRALVGAVIAGPAGLIVGGATAKSVGTTTGKVSRAVLQITINDPRAPLFSVLFVNGEVGSNSPDMDKCREWLARVNVMIRAADEDDAKAAVIEAEETKAPDVLQIQQANLPIQEAPSAATELRKLADLLREGILTPAEFQAQKTKLLGTNA